MNLSITPMRAHCLNIKPRLLVSAVAAILSLAGLNGCNQTPSTKQASNESANVTQPATSSTSRKDANDIFVGCYTVSHSEPAQIKIIKNGDNYAMQMRQFNDPNKDWDNPEVMQLIATDNSEIQKYFDIKAGESKYLEKVIARPDRVFVLAKITDSFASLNPQYDSPYLGFIYKGSNTVYKVNCEQTTQL